MEHAQRDPVAVVATDAAAIAADLDLDPALVNRALKRREAAPPHPLPGQRSTADHAPDALAAALGAPPTDPPEGGWICNMRGCGRVIWHLGICERCAKRLNDEGLRKAVRAWICHLPEDHQDVTWDNVLSLERRPEDGGGPRVRGVDAPRLARIHDGLERFVRAVFVGPAGAGKSTLAVARLRELFERDTSNRVRFVEAADLPRKEAPEGGPTPIDLALSADVLLLDDLGAELEGAPVGSGLLAQRIGPASHVIAERHRRRLPTLVTTSLGRERTDLAPAEAVRQSVAMYYGDRIARRLLEGTATIRLGGGAL